MISINGEAVNTLVFPDNTSQVWKLPDDLPDNVTVQWRYSHEGEVMQLAQLKDLLDHMGIRAQLDISYLPYARQDKPVSNSSCFALYTFARILNGMSWDWITVMDPHSEIALHEIAQCGARYPGDRVRALMQEVKADVLCYPDAGALKKYGKLFNRVSIHGEKVRDQATGMITSYEILGDCDGERVLIVDDICDGGATFRLLAEQLHKAGAEEVFLYVTHGIFSKGVRHLFDAGISRIFTLTDEITRRSMQ